jgi:hypothetical protein
LCAWVHMCLFACVLLFLFLFFFFFSFGISCICQSWVMFISLWCLLLDATFVAVVSVCVFLFGFFLFLFLVHVDGSITWSVSFSENGTGISRFSTIFHRISDLSSCNLYLY